MYLIQNQALLILLLTGFQLAIAVLNFHDEDFFGQTADTYDWSKHPCRRSCTKAPKTCHYVFVVEQFYAMSKACYNCPLNITDCSRPHCIPVDGVPKPVYVVNRQLPGPLIEVCEQDAIVVDVRNRMLSESTTIHWHGFKQKGTPYMDGVPYVSQCPILPGESFRYTFKAADYGTFFYHSHIGNQRGDGLFGPLIVKKSVRRERMAKHYDHDDVHVIITDWMHRTGDDDQAKFYYVNRDTIDNILINGFARSREFQDADGKAVYTPLATFDVAPKSRYRFRLINAGSGDCPIAMNIDNHTMLVISIDSNDIKPVEVDVITIWPGERIDFVLTADQPPDNYWIKFIGYGDCLPFGDTAGVHQEAILRYAGASSSYPVGLVDYELPSVDEQRILNPYNLGSEVKSSQNVDIPDLKAIDKNGISLNKHADQQVYISFNFYDLDNYDYQRKGLYGINQVSSGRYSTLQFNNISLKMPSVPLMSQWDMLGGSDPFCNATHLPKDQNCAFEQCACTHVIQLRLNSVIELVFVAEGPVGDILSLHPLHLHGHFFRVVAMEKLEGNVTVDQVKKLDREGKIRRNLDRAPLKDTIKTPNTGFTIVRFHTNNPGYWFFHCHFEPHNNIGMALIFKAGEHKDFPAKPKRFPTCGSYTPENT